MTPCHALGIDLGYYWFHRASHEIGLLWSVHQVKHPHLRSITVFISSKLWPENTDRIFIRVNIYPGPGKGYLQLIYQPNYLFTITIYPAAYPTLLTEVTIHPGGAGEGAYYYFFNPFITSGPYIPLNLISRYQHYLPSKIHCLVWACTKAMIHIRLFSFCHDIANIIREQLCKFSDFSQY